MDNELAAHLVSLPAPQFARVAAAVLGSPPKWSRDLTAQHVAERLLDPTWVARTLERLGPDANTAMAAVARAGVPVLRKDLSALVSGHDVDPVDQLEELGLLTPVRTGRGMPTHIAAPPGIADIIRARFVVAADVNPGRGPAFAGTRRRFELALMLAVVGQHPPRLTHSGRLHVGDLNRLSAHLEPLGLRPSAIESRLAAWIDLGVAQVRDGTLVVGTSAFEDVPRLHIALALAELAAPSTLDGTLRIVGRLLATGATLSLHAAIDAAQASVLRDRADDSTSGTRGARSELLEVMRSLLSMEAIVLQDAEGRPVLMDESAPFSASTAAPLLAVEPTVAAALNGMERPSPIYSKGHVQSSFEIVADSGCDPSVVARVALWSELVRADRAAVLRLERATVARAKALGYELERLLADLVLMGGREVPANVAVLLQDWFRDAPAPAVQPVAGAPADLGRLRSEALAAMGIDPE